MCRKTHKQYGIKTINIEEKNNRKERILETEKTK